MRLSSVSGCLLLLGLALTPEARRPSNCGLSCFRWKKCMGVVNGSGNRPGQLGDTGIIVLQECGPLKKKGCECDDKEKEDERPKASSSSSSASPARSNSFQPRTLVRPSRRGGVSALARPALASPAPAPASSTPRSLQSLFSNRSRIYRSKRLIGARY